MPLNIDFFQVLLHMLNFVILAGGLTLLLFKPIVKFLNDRREHYENVEKENRKKEEELNKEKSEYDRRIAEADEMIAEKRKSAEKETAEAAKKYIDEARNKAEAIIRNAEQEAEARKEHILDSAQTEIGEIVVSAAEKLVGGTVTPERDGKLYDDFIKLAEESVDQTRKPE